MGKLASKIVSIKLGFEERCIISILSVRVSSGISALLSQSKTGNCLFWDSKIPNYERELYDCKLLLGNIY